MLSLKKDVRGAFVDCLLGYINAMMILNFSQITLPLLALYVVSTYFVFVLGYKSIYGSRREDLKSTIWSFLRAAVVATIACISLVRQLFQLF
jgi:hypothetical protein